MMLSSMVVNNFDINYIPTKKTKANTPGRLVAPCVSTTISPYLLSERPLELLGVRHQSNLHENP